MQNGNNNHKRGLFEVGHAVSDEVRKKIGDANRKPKVFKCDYCGKESITKLSAYNKKKRHFCSRICYALFRKHLLPINEQPSYKGIRQLGESRQVYHKRYALLHKVNMAHLKARRYAREKGAAGSHSLAEWENLKLIYGNKCANCGGECSLTKDHIIPLSSGGSDYIENIQPLCRNCNSKKNNKTIYYENPELVA